MRPYYKHGGITIYHGDCREVLPLIEAESVGVLVTDPPYGVRYSVHKPIALSILNGDESPRSALALLDAVMPLAIQALKRKRHAYVFGKWDLSKYGLGGCVELIWDKCNLGAGDYLAPWAVQHEPIQFGTRRDGSTHSGKPTSGNGAARLRKGSVLRIPRLNSSRARRHPTEKPTLLIRELIESSSRIGDCVLDPFVGTGSTLHAALLEDRRAIGIEIEERYCEIAAKRLRHEAARLGKAA